MCGTMRNLTRHHIDKNPNNNVRSNIIILCRECHDEVHKIKMRDSRKRKWKKYQPGTSKRKRK